MVSSRYLIVSVCLDALDGVIRVVAELVQHHLIHLVVDGHRFRARKQTLWFLILELFVPGVVSDLIDGIARLWVCVQDFGHEVSAVLRQELWDLVIASQNFLVEVGGLRILKRQEATDHGI